MIPASRWYAFSVWCAFAPGTPEKRAHLLGSLAHLGDFGKACAAPLAELAKLEETEGSADVADSADNATRE
jgi:hypothetical protein